MAENYSTTKFNRVSRIILKSILFFLLFILLLIIALHTPPVLNLIRNKTVSYLEEKLGTNVEIGKLRLILPQRIILKDVYLEDQEKDTLLFGGTIDATIAFRKLLQNEVEVKNLTLEDVTARVKRVLPDTVFNFKFIVDAFATEKKKKSDTADTAPLKLALDNLALNNFNVIYRDVITGDDMTINLETLYAALDTLDVYGMKYSIPTLKVDGLTARLKQQKPLVTPDAIEADLAEAAAPGKLGLSFGKAELSDIDVEYENSVSDFYTDLKIGNLVAESDLIDIVNRKIYLDNLSLDDALTSIRLGEKEASKQVEQEIEKEVKAQSTVGWDFRIDEARINNNVFAFENDNNPRQGRGIDYSHLKAEEFTLHVDDFVLNKNAIGGNILEGSFREQSGFQLDQLRGEVMYAQNQSYLKDFYLKTPGTEIKRYALLKYDSYADLAHEFANTFIEADIDDSRIQVKDILAFAPDLSSNPAFYNPNDVWYLNFQGNGTINTMHIADLQFRGLKNTNIDVTGTLAASNDPQRAGGSLRIRRFHTTQSDIALFTGSRLSNSAINLPEEFDITGTLAGSLSNLQTNLNISTSMGSAAVNGRFTNLLDASRTTYNANVRTNSLQLGRILRNPQMGVLSANLKVSGSGLTPNSINARFSGNVAALTLNNYTYRNATLSGTYSGNQLVVDADINDPNVALNGRFTADLTQPSSFSFSGMIDSIKTLPLGLTPGPLAFRGKVDANIPYFTADAIEADVFITQAVFVSNGNRLVLDTVELKAGRNGQDQFIDLRSELANAHIEGRYKYSELGKIFQNVIQPYFSTGTVAASKVSPYDFTFTADFQHAPILTAFMPELKTFNALTSRGRVSSASGITAELTTNYIHYMDYEISDLRVNVNSTDSGLNFVADMARLKSNTLNVFHTTLNATARNNVIDFALNVDDAAGVDKYNVSGILSQPVRGEYLVSLDQGGVLLNYETWTVGSGNSIRITKDNILANNFTLQRADQRITLQSAGNELNVALQNFQISTITGFMKADSLAINGSMNGRITFQNILKQPVFTSDLTVNDLSLKGDTVGNAVVKVDNYNNRYNTNATISGRGNDISLTGYFAPQGENDIALNLDLNIGAIQLSTIEGALNNMIQNASGSVRGNIKIAGTVNNPRIDGPVIFDNASFALKFLGSQFRVDGEQLQVDENGLTFDDFVIRDSSDNTLRLNGQIATSNYTNYFFNLDVEAENFQILNTTKKKNDIYYGQLVITTDIHIDGTEQKPIIDGYIAVNDGTNLFLVIPQKEPGIVQREGVVEFVDMDNPGSDTVLTAYDSLNIADLVGMDIAATIEIKKEAIFNIVIDEANGDFINLQGAALLTAGIDPGGEITLTGTYELERGAYEITFNFLHRRFEIEKGSRIIWLDEPTNATLDINAVYIANTSPIDLVQSQIAESSPLIRATYQQKLPFQVKLNLTGALLEPIVAFDIVLPDDQSYGVSNDIITQVQSRLAQLRQDPGEINKQVFSLLLLNRFVGPNPLESDAPMFSASTYLRQSVSKMLTGQLNKLAAGLIDGVDITFDVISSDDYTTGNRRTRTDLNVGLSKTLLNERLTVSVGSNFELQGPKNSNQQASNVIGNLAVNYALSRDGRYYLRFFRRNEYDFVIDGYVVETGLSFLITVDYNELKELFMSKKKRAEALQNPDE